MAEIGKLSMGIRLVPDDDTMTVILKLLDLFVLTEAAKKAGLEKVHPHKFRRTLATNLTRRGMPIQNVARILGHEKLDTTMGYVVLSDDDIKNDYRRYA